MLKKLRAALAPVGGPQTLIACAAIAWGLGRLQALADERQARLDQIDEAAADVERRLELRLAQLRDTYPPAPADEDATTEGTEPE